MTLDKGTLNVIQLSISFMLQFFAYMSQEFIQEPLIESESRNGANIDKHAGYNSFAILYFFFTISCLIVTPLVEKLTAKWSIAFGLLAYIVFQIGFIHLNVYYLYITSAFLGVGGAFLWIAQGKYLTENCTGKTIERNTAMMWVIFKLSLLAGGVFLYFMFRHQTLSDVVENRMIVYLCLIFASISTVAAINIMLLPAPAYPPEKRQRETIAQTLKSTFKIMATMRMSLLAVLFVYAGFSRSFWIAIYPTCIKFTTRLGENTTKLLALSGIATGVGQTAAGVLFSIIGKHARVVGKDIIVLFASVLHVAVFVLIYLHFPDEAPLHPTESRGILEPNVEISLICSALLGFGDAIVQTQIYSYLVDGYSSESSHAFALFKFYSGASSTIAFYLSQFFTLPMHLILYTICAIMSSISAIIAQRCYFYKFRHFYQDKVKPDAIHIEISENGSVIKK
ncbi:unnamed protein product [Caenorhabditis bovis]|uniref:UNC93-like protein MFSD11 n=1 Tax=Caenorhabditis bovis TaxID=2654633 RepID=A0A8S1EZJ8_9PELO|nr:unnamed protein product [Caenorhabditis bovis]